MSALFIIDNKVKIIVLFNWPLGPPLIMWTSESSI